MRWTDLNFDDKSWTIPRAVTKNKKGDHVVPLADAVIETIRSLPRITVRHPETGKPTLSKLVFTTSGITPISGFGRATERLQKHMMAEAAKGATEGDDAPAVAPFTIHDLRRSAATGMARLGSSHFVIARILNHADASVTGIYNRHDYIAEKRAALDAWAKHVATLANPPAADAGANVEPQPADDGSAVAIAVNVEPFRR